MGQKRYTPDQIIKMLREAEVELSKGETTGQACRKLGITEQTYYNWGQVKKLFCGDKNGDKRPYKS